MFRVSGRGMFDLEAASKNMLHIVTGEHEKVKISSNIQRLPVMGSSFSSKQSTIKTVSQIGGGGDFNAR